GGAAAGIARCAAAKSAPPRAAPPAWAARAGLRQAISAAPCAWASPLSRLRTNAIVAHVSVTWNQGENRCASPARIEHTGTRSPVDAQFASTLMLAALMMAHHFSIWAL